jgi:hypothetical protein
MPGETFQTLKSKATKQAKQSGMSQSSAQDYGSAMASQAAIQGNAGPDFLGSTPQQITQTQKEITNNFDTITGSQGGPAGMTFTEAGDANIMSPLEVSQAQLIQMTNENVQQQIAKRREVEKQVQEAGGVFNPQSGMVEYPQQTNIFDGLGSLNVNDIIDKIPSLTLKGIVGGAKGLQLLLDKAFKPQLEDFSNPNFLAVLDAAFKSGKLNEESWKETYGDLLDDVYSGQAKEDLEAGLGSLDSEGLFDLAMEEATANVEPGSSVQRITNPSEFYTGEQNLTSTGRPIMPQTSGGLADLAGLAVTPEMQGNNPELAKMIFAARAELDRMGKDSSGNPQGGGSTGIPSLYGGPITPSDPNAILKKPGLKNPFGLPDDYSSGFMQSEFYKPNQPGLAVMTPVKMPDGTTHMFGNSASANQFQQYLDYLAMNKMGPSTGTTQAVGTSTGVPAAFNYASIAPQFTGSQYTNQGVSPAFLENLRRFYG